MAQFTHIALGILLLGAVFTSCNKKGCTDPKASNFEERAIKDDGSCKVFKRLTIGDVRVQEVPPTNGSQFWDNSVVIENQAPDVYVVLTNSQNQLIDESNQVYQNDYADGINGSSENLDFTWALNQTITDFSESYFVYVLDDDGNISTDPIMMFKELDLVELTRIDNENKFPESVSLINQDQRMTIDLEWAE